MRQTLLTYPNRIHLEHGISDDSVCKFTLLFSLILYFSFILLLGLAHDLRPVCFEIPLGVEKLTFIL